MKVPSEESPHHASALPAALRTASQKETFRTEKWPGTPLVKNSLAHGTWTAIWDSWDVRMSQGSCEVGDVQWDTEFQAFLENEAFLNIVVQTRFDYACIPASGGKGFGVYIIVLFGCVHPCYLLFRAWPCCASNSLRCVRIAVEVSFNDLRMRVLRLYHHVQPYFWKMDENGFKKGSFSKAVNRGKKSRWAKLMEVVP